MTRVGVVLGGGGVLGAAWMTGAMVSLEERLGISLNDAEVFVGTSAGSVLSASIASGATVKQLADAQDRSRADNAPGEITKDALADLDLEREDLAGGSMPPRPRMRLGSPKMLLHTATHPRRARVLPAMSAFLPQGRGTLAAVRDLVAQVAPEQWPQAPAPWIVAMDYDTGRRTVFGREGSPVATLPEAVEASCSIPGWYAPVTIGRHRYVDGGVCSPTSVDVLRRSDLDEVYVLAPMASTELDSPNTVGARLERHLRRLFTKQVQAECAALRAAGTTVALIGPGRADLQAIGANLMDPRRRRDVFRVAVESSPQAWDRAMHAPATLLAAG